MTQLWILRFSCRRWRATPGLAFPPHYLWLVSVPRGYGEVFTSPQLCLLLQQDRLLNYLLADPWTDVEAKSSPSGWTLLMIACATDVMRPTLYPEGLRNCLRKHQASEHPAQSTASCGARGLRLRTSSMQDNDRRMATA